MKRAIQIAFRAGCYTFALWAVANVAWALSAGTNITFNNGVISVKAPFDPTTLTNHGVLVGQGAASIAATAAGTSGDVLISGGAGADPAYGPVANANVASGAAIARSKLASGSNNHVLINDGSGVMSSEATLAASRGGMGNAAPTCTATQRLTSDGTNTTCSAVPVAILAGTTVTDLTTSQTIYSGGGTADIIEIRASIPVPAGTWGNLRARQTLAAGASNNVSVTVRKGACGSESDTTTTCSITGGASAAACSDTTNVATTTAGQCLNVKVVTPAALSNNQYVLWSLERLS